jgi:hypothetical protein
MRRDNARNQLPKDAAWNLRDVILDYGAPARERAGWAYASSAATSTTASTIAAGLYATFSPTAGAVAQNLAILNNSGSYRLIKVAADGSVTDIGAALQPLQNPVFHGGAAASAAAAVYTGLLIIPDGTGAAVPKVYDGTTLANLHGSPPKAKYATVYRDYTLLGNGTVGSTQFPNRVWYSPVGDPDCFGTASLTAWDTTDSWIDFIQPVRGLASMKNVHLVFGDTQIARVQGSVSPPDTDFTVSDPWQRVGLLDARSITEYQDNVFWCAPEGVFRTDGVTIDDLTQKGGMLRYWLDMVGNATTASTFSTGVIRGKLIITVLNGGVFSDGFMVDLTTYSWTRISNLTATTFWDGVTPNGRTDETFFGCSDEPRVARLGTIFSAVGQSAYKADADGTAVVSVVETPFYEGGDPGLKVWKALYVGYALVDFASDNPTITVEYADTPDSSSYTSVGTLSEQAAYDRRRLRIGGRHHGLGFRLTRVGNGDFLGYSLEADVTPLEGSKLT